MSLKKPWLFLSPQLAHDLSPKALSIISYFAKRDDFQWRSFQWRHLNFRNPLGIAGGVDKNVEQVEAWTHLGCGFIEVGTITPLAQDPNPGKILDRNLPHNAVWNKMGFPNQGLESAIEKLRKLQSQKSLPLFANIGKNRQTPNDKAAEDYKKCIQGLEKYVDAFVINISSPNTKNLRELLTPVVLKPFLLDVLSVKKQSHPVLLKLSPDLDESTLKDILDVSLECQIDGWIFTNTTLQRPQQIPFPEEGGLSGKPLADIAKKVLKNALDHLAERKKNKLVISTGGIMNEKDVMERLEMGADLVQVYSALIFEGPFFFKHTLNKLKSLRPDTNV